MELAMDHPALHGMSNLESKLQAQPVTHTEEEMVREV